MRFAGATDVGRGRSHNEDGLSLRGAEQGVFIVTDGLGGHQGGRTASELALNYLESALVEIAGMPEIDLTIRQKLFTEAVVGSDREIKKVASQDPALLGMGCTMVACLILKSCLLLSHVGDARAYLWRGNILQRLTEDHTEVATLLSKGVLTEEESRFYPYRHRVDRALGLLPDPMADVQVLKARLGDRLLLCSDGLWSMLDDERLRIVLQEESAPQECVTRLVDEANGAGGRDNITLVLIEPLAEDLGYGKHSATV